MKEQNYYILLRDRLADMLTREENNYNNRITNNSVMIMNASRISTLRSVIKLMDEISPIEKKEHTNNPVMSKSE